MIKITDIIDDPTEVDFALGSMWVVHKKKSIPFSRTKKREQYLSEQKYLRWLQKRLEGR